MSNAADTAQVLGVIISGVHNLAVNASVFQHETLRDMEMSAVHAKTVAESMDQVLSLVNETSQLVKSQRRQLRSVTAQSWLPTPRIALFSCESSIVHS